MKFSWHFKLASVNASDKFCLLSEAYRGRYYLKHWVIVWVVCLAVIIGCADVDQTAVCWYCVRSMHATRTEEFSHCHLETRAAESHKAASDVSTAADCVFRVELLASRWGVCWECCRCYSTTKAMIVVQVRVTQLPRRETVPPLSVCWQTELIAIDT